MKIILISILIQLIHCFSCCCISRCLSEVTCSSSQLLYSEFASSHLNLTKVNTETKQDEGIKEEKKAIDSILYFYENNKIIRLYIYKYHDSITKSPIRDFVVLDEKDSVLLKFDGEPFLFENEGPRIDEFLHITPCFYIVDSSKLNLKLKFKYEYNLQAYRYLIQNVSEDIFNNTLIEDSLGNLTHNIAKYSIRFKQNKTLIHKETLLSTSIPAILDFNQLYNEYIDIKANDFTPVSRSNAINRDLILYTIKKENPNTNSYISDFREFLAVPYNYYYLYINFYFEYLF